MLHGRRARASSGTKIALFSQQKVLLIERLNSHLLQPFAKRRYSASNENSETAITARTLATFSALKWVTDAWGRLVMSVGTESSSFCYAADSATLKSARSVGNIVTASDNDSNQTSGLRALPDPSRKEFHDDLDAETGCIVCIHFVRDGPWMATET